MNNMDDGILLIGSRSNFITRNTIRGNDDGLEISANSDQNTINSNLIEGNSDNGIDIENSEYNSITANAFLNQSPQVDIFGLGKNSWDGGYPDGGNYWSPFIGPQDDQYQGPDQDQQGSDGFWDHPYFISSAQDIKDNYPLVESPIKVPTSITISLSHRRINLGNELIVSGEIVPAVSGETVTLTFNKPSGERFYRSDTTEADGSYEHPYSPDKSGDWSVKVSWGGNPDYSGSESSLQTFYVNPSSTPTTGDPSDPPPWIPGFPWESILIGAFLGLVTIYILKRKKISASLNPN
jgi:parallel beta-helix repeat protein